MDKYDYVNYDEYLTTRKDNKKEKQPKKIIKKKEEVKDMEEVPLDNVEENKFKEKANGVIFANILKSVLSEFGTKDVKDKKVRSEVNIRFKKYLLTKITKLDDFKRLTVVEKNYITQNIIKYAKKEECGFNADIIVKIKEDFKKLNIENKLSETINEPKSQQNVPTNTLFKSAKDMKGSSPVDGSNVDINSYISNTTNLNNSPELTDEEKAEQLLKATELQERMRPKRLHEIPEHLSKYPSELPESVELSEPDKVFNYKLIANGKFDELYDRLKEIDESYVEQIFSSEQEAIKYYQQDINMIVFLDLPSESPFLDIFHEEENPSSGVYEKDNTPIQLYKCHSNSAYFTGDILRVVQKLLNLTSRQEALLTLLTITKSTVDYSDEYAELENNIDYLLNDLTLKKTNYPFLKKFLSLKDIKIVESIVDTIKGNPFYDNETETYKYIYCKSMDNFEYEVKDKCNIDFEARYFWTLTSLLVSIGFLKKLAYDEVPKLFQDKYLNRQNEIKKAKKVRTSNIWSFGDFSEQGMEEMENKAEVIRKHGIENKKHIKYSSMCLLFGQDIAYKAFPQSFKTSSGVDLREMSTKYPELPLNHEAFYDEFIIYCRECLTTKSYIRQDEISSVLDIRNNRETDKSKRLSKNAIEELVSIFGAKLIIDENLTVSYPNKSLRAKYNIPDIMSNKTKIYYR